MYHQTRPRFSPPGASMMNSHKRAPSSIVFRLSIVRHSLSGLIWGNIAACLRATVYSVQWWRRGRSYGVVAGNVQGQWWGLPYDGRTCALYSCFPASFDCPQTLRSTETSARSSWSVPSLLGPSLSGTEPWCPWYHQPTRAGMASGA